MRHRPKGPSRFIPTLTEVVVEPRSPDTSDLSELENLGAQERVEAPRDAAPLSGSAQAAPVLPQVPVPLPEEKAALVLVVQTIFFFIFYQTQYDRY